MNKKSARQARWGTGGIRGLCLVLLFSCPGILPAQTGTEVGRVMDISGIWMIEDKPVKLYQAVPAGCKIYRSQEDLAKYPKMGRISILLRDKSKIVRSYEGSEPSPGPIEIPGTVADPSPGFWDRVKEFLVSTVNDRGDVAPTLVRGVNSQLQDGILCHDGKRLILAASFRSMKEGKYLVRLKPLGAHAKPAAKLNRIPFVWNSSSQAGLNVTGITPGLYKLLLLEETGEDHDPTGEEAVVYIANQEAYSKASADFQEASLLADQISNAIPSDAKKSFLRVALQSIAQKY